MDKFVSKKKRYIESSEDDEDDDDLFSKNKITPARSTKKAVPAKPQRSSKSTRLSMDDDKYDDDDDDDGNDDDEEIHSDEAKKSGKSKKSSLPSKLSHRQEQQQSKKKSTSSSPKVSKDEKNKGKRRMSSKKSKESDEDEYNDDGDVKDYEFVNSDEEEGEEEEDGGEEESEEDETDEDDFEADERKKGRKDPKSRKAATINTNKTKVMGTLPSESKSKNSTKARNSHGNISNARSESSPASSSYLANDDSPSSVSSLLASFGKVQKDVEISKDLKEVLRRVTKLAEIERKQNNGQKLSLEDLHLPDVSKEVKTMEDEDVSAAIEHILLYAAMSILAGNGLNYDVPSRSSSNQLYVPELDRIVLKNAITSRQFNNTATVRKTAITTRVLQLVHEVVNKRIHITKRDLFYTDVKLFQKQTESDAVLDDVACMVGCTRTSLNVVASEKGVVIGRVTFRDDGDLIDCTKMGVGGKAIPSLIDRITDMQGDAQFVLLVEKDAAFMRLSEDRFYNQYPCIIITAKGQPDVSTRLFLNMVKTTLKIPILGLVDSDPYGLKILSVYMSGSKNMSYDSANLTTSDIKWLGVRPSDLDAYNIPPECRLDMTDSDIKYGQDLMKEDFIKKNPIWMKELELMLKTKQKAEIQALSNFGFQYLTQVYLPKKIQKGDWI